MPAPGSRRSPRSPGPALRRLGDLRAPRGATGARSSAALPEVATAVADALDVGRSLRAALAGRPGLARGPAGARARAGPRRARARRADRGRRSRACAGACARRASTRSRAALLSQQLAGGDLAALLRRFAAAAAERDRVEDDARSATAQARFTGLLVVAMPAGAALFAELLEPGFVGGLLADPAAAALLGCAARAAARRLRRDPAAEQGRGSDDARCSPRSRCCSSSPPPGSSPAAPASGSRRWPRARSRGSRAAAPRRWPSSAGGSGCRGGSPGPGSSAPTRARCVAAKLAGALAGAPGRSARRPGAPARGSRSRRSPASPVAGFLAPDALARAGGAPRAGGGSSPRFPTRSTCSRSGPRPGATRPAASPRSQRPAPPGPLTGELARAVAEIECGRPLREALAALRRRVPGAEVGGAGRGDRALAPLRLAARRPAAPAGDRAARRAARRRIEERAARAAPKIQLVVALVLVPSVLLMIAAALVAHSDELLGQF